MTLQTKYDKYLEMDDSLEKWTEECDILRELDDKIYPLNNGNFLTEKYSDARGEYLVECEEHIDEP